MAKQPTRTAKKAPPAKPRHYVKEWRIYRGLTQEQLAERIEKSRGLITQIEIGLTSLKEETIYALENALRTGPGDLFRVNPLKEGKLVDIQDLLRGKEQDVQAEAFGYVQALVNRTRH